MSGIFDGLPGFEHSENSTETMYVIAAELGIDIGELRPVSELIGVMVLGMIANASKESTLKPSNPRFEVSVKPDNLSTSPVFCETAQTLESMKSAVNEAKK